MNYLLTELSIYWICINEAKLYSKQARKPLGLIPAVFHAVDIVTTCLNACGKVMFGTEEPRLVLQLD